MMNVLRKFIIHPVCIHNQFSATNLRNITYKSSLSLDKLYPNCNLKITTPEPPNNSEVAFTGYIPLEELQITYSRSSGPGGQNVNKVNTKVDLRFQVQSAKWLSDKAREKLLEKCTSRLTKDGYLIFVSDMTRSQQMNLADCLEKLRSAIRNALVEDPKPSPETEERIRRRLERAAQERLLVKRQRSQVKRDRQMDIAI